MTSLEKFFSILEDNGIQVTPEDAADAFWLATRLLDENKAEFSIQRLLELNSEKGESPIDKFETSVKRELEEKQIPQKAEEPSREEDFHSTPSLYAYSSAKGKTIKGHSIRVPSAPLLPQMLEMERALRPLSQRKPSKQKWELDEKGTVDFIASSGVWNIVKRPAAERWLEGVLIVEQSPTMRLWHDAVREFRHLLWRVGAFRWLDTVYLNAFSSVPRLTSAPDLDQNRPPLSICRAYSPRVIFLFTDCLSDPWLNGKIPEWLAQWEKENPTVIMQMLPDYMWGRTSLRNATFVVGTSTAPITTPRLPNGKQKRTSALELMPVVSLNPQSLRELSDFLICSPQNSIACYLNAPMDFRELSEGAEQTSVQSFQPTVDMAEIAYKRFKETASPLTLELARYLAITPLFLPVMRLIQHNLVPNSEPAHLAELFNSGILYRLSSSGKENVNQIEYDFLPGIREKLLRQGSTLRISEVRRVLSEYLNERFERGADFLAILYDPLSTTEYASGIREEAQLPFARVATTVLSALGIKYAGAIASDFVDRTAETEIFSKLILGYESKRGRSDDRVIHLIGRSNIGKTYLLRYWEKIFGQNSNLFIMTMSFKPFLDFSRDQFAIHVLDFLYNRIVGMPTANHMQKNVHDLEHDLQKELDILQRRKTVVLLMDDVNILSDDQIEVLEDYLLSRFISFPNTVLVLTGRHVISRWKDFSLRPTVNENVIELMGFDLYYTQKQIELLRPQAVDLAPEIFRISGGSPGNNKAILDQASGNPLQINELDAIHACNQDLYDAIASQALPDDIADELLPALEALCVLQDFDKEYEMPVMLAAHNSLGGVWDVRRSVSVFSILSGIQVGPGKLVDWDKGKSAYAIEEQTRFNLEQELKIRDRDLWKILHCTAMKLYAQWASDYNSDIFAGKSDYHRTQLATAGLDPSECNTT